MWFGNWHHCPQSFGMPTFAAHQATVSRCGGNVVLPSGIYDASGVLLSKSISVWLLEWALLDLLKTSGLEAWSCWDWYPTSFTDGSCSDPTSPLMALAGMECSLGWFWWTSANRTFTRHFAHHGFLLCHEGMHVSSTTSPGSIRLDWSRLVDWNSQKASDLSTALTFRKVAAHRAHASGVDDLDNDIIHWNSIADTSAKVARSSGLPERLSQVHCHLKRYHQWQAYWAKRC